MNGINNKRAISSISGRLSEHFEKVENRYSHGEKNDNWSIKVEHLPIEEMWSYREIKKII
jgi:hypothetical protein